MEQAQEWGEFIPLPDDDEFTRALLRKLREDIERIERELQQVMLVPEEMLGGKAQ